MRDAPPAEPTISSVVNSWSNVCTGALSETTAVKVTVTGVPSQLKPAGVEACLIGTEQRRGDRGRD